MTPLPTQPQPGDRPGHATKAISAIVILAALALASRYFDLPELFRQALAWIDGAGAAGMAAFFLLYIAACVFMIPGSLLTLGAGAVYGVGIGFILVLFSATAGAVAAFLTGRYLARDLVAGRIEKNPKFRAVDQAVALEGWKIVGLTRLSPVFPFNLLNYAFGLTRVSLRDYTLATFIGMIPGALLYVYVGSLAGSLAALGAEGGARTRTSAEWALYFLGFAATVAVTIVITRIARRALESRINPAQEAGSGDVERSGA